MRRLSIFLGARHPCYTDGNRLRQALLVLDCYRVVFDQRPPLLSLSISALVHLSSEADPLFGQLRCLTGATPTSELKMTPGGSLSTLSALAALTWNVVPPSFSRQIPLRTLWSSGFCELSLQRWLEGHAAKVDAGAMLLYHVVHINMLVCLPAVQSLVVKVLASAEPGSIESTDHPLSGEHVAPPDQHELRKLFAGPDSRPKAIWHAHQVLYEAKCLMEESDLGKMDLQSDSIHRGVHNISPSGGNRTQSSRRPRWRPAHYSHCLSFALLTLWCDNLLRNGRNEHLIKPWLEIGIELLSDSTGYGSDVEILFKSIFADLAKRT